MANKLNPNVAMKMTIAQLAAHFGWSYRTQEYICRQTYSWRDEKPDHPCAKEREMTPAEYREAVLQFLEEHTLRDLLNDMEALPKWRNCSEAMALRLKAIGLTRLDTLLLPNTTVTFELLSKLDRDDLLGRDAGALGTFSDRELLYKANYHHRYGYYNDEVMPRLTVRDVLQSHPSRFRGWGAAKTIALLERLGFGPEDGPFMAKENDPRHKLVEELVVKEGLTKAEATKFADIAARHNWI